LGVGEAHDRAQLLHGEASRRGLIERKAPPQCSRCGDGAGTVQIQQVDPVHPSHADKGIHQLEDINGGPVVSGVGQIQVRRRRLAPGGAAEGDQQPHPVGLAEGGKGPALGGGVAQHLQAILRRPVSHVTTVPPTGPQALDGVVDQLEQRATGALRVNERDDMPTASPVDRLAALGRAVHPRRRRAHPRSLAVAAFPATTGRWPSGRWWWAASAAGTGDADSHRRPW
jgi:hypothetical protein